MLRGNLYSTPDLNIHLYSTCHEVAQKISVHFFSLPHVHSTLNRSNKEHFAEEEKDSQGGDGDEMKRSVYVTS